MLLNQYLKYQEIISSQGTLFNKVVDYVQIGFLNDIKNIPSVSLFLSSPVITTKSQQDQTDYL